MEVREIAGRARLSIRVPEYCRQVIHEREEFECIKELQVGAARVTLKIKLDLFAEPKKYRYTVTQKSKHEGRNHQISEWISPRDKQNSPAIQRQTPNKKAHFFNSPDAKPLKYSEHLTPVPKNSPGAPASPRFKKSALQGLYTKGGIEEIIYGDSEWVTKDSSPRSIQNKTVENKTNFAQLEVADADSDQLDVGVLVECIQTNMPLPLLRRLEVTSGIGERTEQLRTLGYEGDGWGRWRGVLVPRVSVRSYDLLQAGALDAWLEVGFPSEVLDSCQNSLLTLSRDLRVMLETHDASADAVLITTDGGRLPAHLSLLRARSNLLASCTLLSHAGCDIALMVDGRSPTLSKPHALRPATPPQLGASDPDASEKLPVPRHRFNSADECSGKGGSGRKVAAHNRLTPRKLEKTPFRKPTITKLSQKLTSADRLELFSKSNVTEIPLNENKENLRLNSILDDESQFLDEEKHVKDLNQCFIECNDTKDSSLTSTMDLQVNNEEGRSLSALEENFSHLSMQFKSPAKHVRPETTAHRDDRVHIQVNMSTSVAKQFLEWIYAGECSDLPALCRPLLLAGRRHGVPQLAAAAEQHLALQLDVDTAPGLLQLAHTHQAQHLLQEALRFVRLRAPAVTATPAWENVISRCPQLGVLVTRSVFTKEI